MTLRDNRGSTTPQVLIVRLCDIQFRLPIPHRHLRRARPAAQPRCPAEFGLGERGAREHQRRRAPHANHRHATNGKEGMAGGLAPARHHLHGSDDTLRRRHRRACSPLCAKARQPIQHELVQKLGIGSLNIKVAAVCVYHTFVETARRAIEGSGIHVAAVSTGFPAGLSPFEERVAEIRRSVEAGADEIDVVITRAHVFGR